MKWTNKIIGHDEVAPDQLLAHPLNWRLHPQYQQKTLSDTINDVGYIKSVTVNKTTGRVIDGHLRVTLAMRNEEETIPVEYVELSETEEAEALLVLDPIAGMAMHDEKNVGALSELVATESSRIKELIEGLTFSDNVSEEKVLDEGGAYSRKIEVPIYEPSGVKPQIDDIVDRTRTIELIEQIDKSTLDQKEKDFLKMAAERHAVFNFKLIADYYSHSGEDMKDMMEKSALIIIDFEKAIEEGFVEISKEIADQYTRDYLLGDADGG